MVTATLSELFTPWLHNCLSEQCRVFNPCGSVRHAFVRCNFEHHKKQRASLASSQYTFSRKFAVQCKFALEKQLVDESANDELIKELTSKGFYDDAVTLYIGMLENGFVASDFRSFPVLVKSVGGVCDLELTRQIHGHLLKLGVVKDVYVANSLLSTLWKCGSVDDAIKMFERMQDRDSVSWSSMISGLYKSRLYIRSLEWFRRMAWESESKANRVACLSALSSCASIKSLIHGQEIHTFVIKSGLIVDEFLLNGLLDMYVKCGCVWYAKQLFQSILDDAGGNTVLWNVMIAGYVDNRCFSEALLLFIEMMVSAVEPDSTTMVAVLVLCSKSLNLAFGKQIHALIIKTGMQMDVRVATSLIDMYFNCSNPECGLQIFNSFHNHNLIMWGTVITNCARSGYSRKALNLYVVGIERGFLDPVILLAALRACSSLNVKREGMAIHGMVVKLGLQLDTYIGSALIDMYAKGQEIEYARKTFKRLPVMDEVSWSSLISGYAQNELWDDTVKALYEMHHHRIRPNAVIIACVLSTCARVFGNLQCKEIHGYILRHGFLKNILVNNSFIVAYAKCGDMESSRRVFLQMGDKDVVSWNSIMLALGLHGHTNEMLVLFDKMKGAGLKPDHQTFTAILSACSHTGRVAEGMKYFKSMVEEHKLKPNIEQYTCLVDLLGRAGYLDQAYELIRAMPYSPDDRIWGSLLGSCRIHGDERLAELVANNIFELDPTSVGYRVLIANLYEDSGKWNQVSKFRSEIKNMGLKKSPGCSWIDVNKQVHVFTASDQSHEQVEAVYDILKYLTKEMRRDGYIPQL